MRALLVILLLTAVTGCGSAPDLSSVKANMAAEQLAIAEPIADSVGIIFVPIPAGEFQMGTPKDKNKKRGGRGNSDRPAHRVQITTPFYLSSCEITQEQFRDCDGGFPLERSAVG
ncbi:MAG: hypothetical protein CMJ78_12360 [Planctomycetaceae bacterium]|nr:hypothetical protein [Planctomycetaceae bacterium]